MKRLSLIFFCLLLVNAAFGQRYMLHGNVTSTVGELMPGVNIHIKGTTIGTISDIDGNFEIAVKNGDVVVLSFIGYVPQEVKISNQKHVDVALSPDKTSLDEVVVVGYGETKKITNTGAVSAIKAEELKTIPVSNVQNALNGKIPGFFSQQRSGQPGNDASEIFIRGVSSLNPDGNKPLIIVDDVQYSYDQLQQININEIESISILKDASTTAIYGIKGANGVLIIKTKRGREGKPMVNVRMEGGLQTPVRKPEFLDSYQTALLVNEAYANDGLQPLFSDEDIALFQSGEDPYGHPNVNWYDVIFKTFAYQQNMNLDISGGSERLKYFISGGAFSQNGLVRNFDDPLNEVNTNYFYTRYNYRTNLDFQVTKTLKARLDMTMRFANINQPRGMNAISEIYNFSKIHPYSAPVLNPDGSYTYAYDTEEKEATINARIANGGYQRTRRTDGNILLGAEQDLGFIAEGLSLHGRLSFSSLEENSRYVYRSFYPTYHYDPVTGAYSIDPRGNYAYGNYVINSNQGVFSKHVNGLAYLNYDKIIKDVHNLKLTFLFNRESIVSVANVPQNSIGTTAKINYNYQEKFMIDLNGAYNGTDRFDADHRFGFFPAVGIGYNLAKEDYFSTALPDISLFKLRASYGLVGSDAAYGNRYLYQQVYYTGGGYHFGEEPVNYTTVYEGDLGNDNVTWEKAKTADVGLDANFLNNKVSTTIDFFYTYRFDQLVNREDVPGILGVGVAPYNVAITENKGFDGEITYQTKVGNDLHINTNLVFSYAKNKVLYKAEAQQAYPWLAETGLPINQPFGYHYIGFYSEEDIATLSDADPNNDVAIPLSDIPVQAGDLKYEDKNTDGIINNLDMGPIGKPNLQTTNIGWSFGGYYKGFSFRVLFQGSFNYSFSVVGTGIEPFQSQFQPIHLTRWTPETAATAEFPRLTSNPTTVNSGSAFMSDFWLIDAWYIRLKTIDLGYNIPQERLPFNISRGRIYVNAYNLLTFTSYDKYQQDPEISTNTAGDAYLNQRVVNLGIEIGF